MKTPRSAQADASRQHDRPADRDLVSAPDRGREDRAVEDRAPTSATVDPASTLADRVDLAGLSIVGITRRRVGWVAAGLLSIWVVIVFARQVGDAAAATSQAEQLARDNTALAAEVEALQGEVEFIVQPQYIAIQARAHGLGSSREIPFSLSPTVAAPVEGAPGSASVRLGSELDHSSPLESWLSLLFGPGR